jgi:CubicO group peptidase (beta-lactamase class C family)
LITVRHILGHTSGLSASGWATVEVDPPDDFLKLALDQQLVREPGSEAEYNNLAGMVLPAMIERVSGRGFLDFVGGEVFEPLGITDWAWETDVAGHALSMATLCLSAVDLNRIGRLLLEGLDGRSELLSAEWLARCAQPVLPNAPGFGLGVFLHPDSGCFGHTGSGGQHLWCYPSSGLVISRLRDNRLPDGGFSLGSKDQWLQELPTLGARVGWQTLHAEGPSRVVTGVTLPRRVPGQRSVAGGCYRPRRVPGKGARWSSPAPDRCG